MKLQEFAKGARVWSAYATINSSWDDKPVAMINEYEVVDPSLGATRGVGYNGELMQMVHILSEAYATQEEAWDACADKMTAKLAEVEQKIAYCREMAKKKGELHVSRAH